MWHRGSCTYTATAQVQRNVRDHDHTLVGCSRIGESAVEPRQLRLTHAAVVGQEASLRALEALDPIDELEHVVGVVGLQDRECLLVLGRLLVAPDDRDVVPGLLNWHDLASVTVQRIRAIDPQRTIIVEAPPGSGVTTLPNFTPLSFDNIIYSFHMYEPGKFTFQNLRANTTPPVYYPGMIDGKMWNKDQLRTLMQPNVDWQKRHNVSIHVGEFSAIRWAPGNSTANYLSDVIELFEEFGWTWNYHAFREWQGWDVEMIGDMNNPHRSSVPTDRQQVLMKWFQQNQFS